MDPVALHLRHLDDAWTHRWESLAAVLDGVTEPEASWQAPCYENEEPEAGWPAPGTIRWQVAHVAHCKRHYAACIRRRGEEKPPEDPVRAPTRSFVEDRAELEAAHADERAAVAGCGPADLEARMFNAMPLGEFLAMVVRHDVWHAGQIALARRLWRTRADGAKA